MAEKRKQRPRLTDAQKKKICADYALTGNLSETARRNGGISHHTVKLVIDSMPDFIETVQRKNEETTADILDYMEKQRDRVCEIIDIGLRVLPEKIENAKSASEVTTAIGTVIDKWTQAKAIRGQEPTAEDDALTASIRALGEKMEAERANSKKRGDSPAE